MFCLSKNNAAATSLLVFCVVTLLQSLAYGQAYHFIIGHHQHNFDQLYRESNTRTYAADTNFADTATTDLNNINSTVIVTTLQEETNELSQTAMDIITIVWYVATFLALAAFFLLMACSDRRRSDNQRNASMNYNEQQPIPPPTPSPSYSEFAPPSYDSVMKMQHAKKNSIFVIPFSLNVEQNATKDTNGNITNNNNSKNETALTPNIQFYTINELRKEAS